MRKATGKLDQGSEALASESRGNTLDREIARRYHQPENVEQFGIEAIPEDRRTVRWYDLFSIILNFLVNPGTIVIGAAAVTAGLSFWAAVVSLVAGISIAFGAYVVMATVGVDHGLPGQVATRFAYGIRGAKVMPSLLRTISSIYWFAFQTIAGALGIVAVLEQLTGNSYSLVLVSLIFAAVQVFVAVVGYHVLKQLSRIAFVTKILITGLLIYVLMSRQAPSSVLSFTGDAGWNWALMAVWINSSAAAWLSMITDAADFCRYSRSRLDMWVGTFLAAILGQGMAVFLGAYAAASVAGGTTNPFDVMATGAAVWLLAVILIYVVFDNWTINVLNLYTGGLALANAVTRIGRFWTTLIVSAIGVGLSIFPSIVNNYTSYMTVMGNLFAPIAGVLIADYVFLRRLKIDIPSLYEQDGRYWYWNGFNWVALAWTAIGFTFSFFVPEHWVKVFTTMIVTGVLYLITQLILKERVAKIREATVPVEVLVDAEQFDRQLLRQTP